MMKVRISLMRGNSENEPMLDGGESVFSVRTTGKTKKWRMKKDKKKELENR